MNSLRLTPPNELPFAIEDHDVERGRRTGQHPRSDLPRTRGDGVAEENALARMYAEYPSYRARSKRLVPFLF